MPARVLSSLTISGWTLTLISSLRGLAGILTASGLIRSYHRTSKIESWILPNCGKLRTIKIIIIGVFQT
jgi:hypothetical protein